MFATISKQLTCQRKKEGAFVIKGRNQYGFNPKEWNGRVDRASLVLSALFTACKADSGYCSCFLIPFLRLDNPPDAGFNGDALPILIKNQIIKILPSNPANLPVLWHKN